MSDNSDMARRGEQLREHILWAAKDAFLELGFERTSMDLVAARAETSKRSLYAHFENKEKLFLAVIELVRSLFLDRLRMPGEDGEEAAEALTLFCARYLEGLLYGPTIQMCRVCLAEVGRFPEGAARYFDVLFTQPTQRLSAYLQATLGLSTAAGDAAAQTLLGRVIYPRLPRALFGLDPLTQSLARDALMPEIDAEPIRQAVADVLAAFPQR